ncbi:MAG TPA: lysylphosphatidylglycerol synthase transmembrane domain-containing protein [Bacteroidia bacterium]|jgi:uncharacterized protein (TIRG00374 family)|nr:lysylphosphatidylglycerol synthase transmembrane domain-containing protein [Bacteroidia bacterium]HMU20182.1 lysylphosphatidylglycerol synthase transmembrane domain-containing protein [Bacteroidia bacterium]
MQIEGKDVLQRLNPKKIIWPMLIGLSVAGWLFYDNYDSKVFTQIDWTWHSTFWMILAGFSVFVRDLAYMIRIRVLTDNELTWYRSFIVIMLWEFSSALAPGIIGGGFLFAIFILNREGINLGKSITTITFTSFLDGVFLAVMAPLVYLLVGKEALFSGVNVGQSSLGTSIFYSFWVVYFIILAYKLFIAYALFINPYLIKKILTGICSFPVLKRFRKGAIETGDQLIIASNGLKDKNLKYWMLSLLATFASWTARYSIVNCLIHAFHGQTALSDLIVYGKQVIMGIIILLSPTPGGSGIAELMFTDFLGEFIHKGLAPTLGILWRLISYYPYLIVGALILPRWIRERIVKKIF